MVDVVMIFKTTVWPVLYKPILKNTNFVGVIIFTEYTKKVPRNLYKSEFSLTLKKIKYIQFAGCRADKQNRGNCQYWKNRGYCHRRSQYYAYMKDHCYATCNNCRCKYNI